MAGLDYLQLALDVGLRLLSIVEDSSAQFE